MRQETDGLYHLFKPFSSHFIEQNCKKYRHDQIKYNFPYRYYQRISKNIEGVGKHEHIFEIIKAYPRGFKEAQDRLKILKGHNIPKKGKNRINKQNQNSGQQHKMQRPGSFQGNLFLFCIFQVSALLLLKTGRCIRALPVFS